jgi:hypothetical protein
LLVENYNYDCSSWLSGRLGIFETQSVRCYFSLIFAAYAAELKKSCFAMSLDLRLQLAKAQSRTAVSGCLMTATLASCCIPARLVQSRV